MNQKYEPFAKADNKVGIRLQNYFYAYSNLLLHL